METAAATAMITHLSDDIIREILVRVDDATALFRCARACKRWRVLVADPSFLRRRWPVDAPNSSTLVGFLATQIRSAKPVFVPAPRSPIGTSRRPLSSFHGGDGFLDNTLVLASRRGLLLVRIVERGCGGPIQLAVCNILAGTCDLLPPLKRNTDFCITGYTVLTIADSCSDGQKHRPLSPGYSSFFKVLIIGVHMDGARRRYDLFMFSSDELSWTPPRECLSNHDDASAACLRGSAVVCRGTTHWLVQCTSNYYTLDVSVDTGQVSLTKLLTRSSPFSPQLIVTVDGTLALLHMHQEGNRIDIWKRQEKEGGDGAAQWLCTRIIELKRPCKNPTFSICVGERSNSLLFGDPCVHVANLETGTTENVHEQFEGLFSEKAKPLMVDWPSLFMSRLCDSGKKCT